MNKYIIIEISKKDKEHLQYPYIIYLKDMVDMFEDNIQVKEINNRIDEKRLIKAIKDYKKIIVLKDVTEIKETSFFNEVYNNNIDIVDVKTMISNEFKMMFLTDIIDVIDYFNMECEIPKSPKENVDVIFTIIKEICSYDMLLRNVDSTKEIIKTLKVNDFNRENYLVNIHQDITKGYLSGYNLVFTGRGPYVRSHLTVLARRAGAIVSSTVSSRTNLLVVGEKPGSKLNRAKRLNMQIVDMDYFFNMMEGKQKKEIIERNDCKVCDDIIQITDEMKMRVKNFISFRTVVIYDNDDESIKMIMSFLKECQIQCYELDEENIDLEDKNQLVIYSIKYQASNIIKRLNTSKIQTISKGEFEKIVGENIRFWCF